GRGGWLAGRLDFTFRRLRLRREWGLGGKKGSGLFECAGVSGGVFTAAFGVGRPSRECQPTPVEFPQPLLAGRATCPVRLPGLPLRGAGSAGQEPLQFSTGRACVGHMSPPSRSTPASSAAPIAAGRPGGAAGLKYLGTSGEMDLGQRWPCPTHGESSREG